MTTSDTMYRAKVSLVRIEATQDGRNKNEGEVYCHALILAKYVIAVLS